MLVSTLKFTSNLYLVGNEERQPYNDFQFIKHVYNPQKIEQIMKFSKFSDDILTEQQRKILDNDAVCVYSKKILQNDKAQCFVFKKKGDENISVCKCKALECPRISKCRPNQEELIKKEIEEFSKLKISKERNTDGYYPKMRNFDRVLEKYNDYAYELLANTDLRKYIVQRNENITFSYQGQSNGKDWDNWDEGDLNKYFENNMENKIPIVSISFEENKNENPLFAYQRKQNAMKPNKSLEDIKRNLQNK